ncbi:MAG: hypothetical protein AAF546_11590 [Verrucomicrobiota bacterium]
MNDETAEQTKLVDAKGLLAALFEEDCRPFSSLASTDASTKQNSLHQNRPLSAV